MVVHPDFILLLSGAGGAGSRCAVGQRDGGSPGIVVETVFGDTFRFSPNLAIPGFQGLVTFAINMIPGEPGWFERRTRFSSWVVTMTVMPMEKSSPFLNDE
jgi:hypothetical protein